MIFRRLSLFGLIFLYCLDFIHESRFLAASIFRLRRFAYSLSVGLRFSFRCLFNNRLLYRFSFLIVRQFFFRKLCFFRLFFRDGFNRFFRNRFLNRLGNPIAHLFNDRKNFLGGRFFPVAVVYGLRGLKIVRRLAFLHRQDFIHEGFFLAAFLLRGFAHNSFQLARFFRRLGSFNRFLLDRGGLLAARFFNHRQDFVNEGLFLDVYAFLLRGNSGGFRLGLGRGFRRFFRRRGGLAGRFLNHRRNFINKGFFLNVFDFLLRGFAHSFRLRLFFRHVLFFRGLGLRYGFRGFLLGLLLNRGLIDGFFNDRQNLVSKSLLVADLDFLLRGRFHNFRLRLFFRGLRLRHGFSGSGFRRLLNGFLARRIAVRFVRCPDSFTVCFRLAGFIFLICALVSGHLHGCFGRFCFFRFGRQRRLIAFVRMNMLLHSADGNVGLSIAGVSMEVGADQVSLRDPVFFTANKLRHGKVSANRDPPAVHISIAGFGVLMHLRVSANQHSLVSIARIRMLMPRNFFQTADQIARVVIAILIVHMEISMLRDAAANVALAVHTVLRVGMGRKIGNEIARLRVLRPKFFLSANQRCFKAFVRMDMLRQAAVRPALRKSTRVHSARGERQHPGR